MKMLDGFLPILSYIENLKESPDIVKSLQFNKVRTDIERLLTDCAVGVADYGYSEEQFDYARFAIVVSIDEAILLLDWSEKSEWKKNMLQKEYYNIANGGAEFYDRLEQLNPVNLAEKDIRQIYFYVLCLGFSGKLFRSEDKAKKQEIIRACHALLFDNTRLSQDVIFPAAYSDNTATNQIKRPMNFTALTFAIPILTVIGFFYSLKHEALVQGSKILGLF